jgi:hypothetical protein
MLNTLLGIEFAIRETTKQDQPTHALQFWLCEHSHRRAAAGRVRRSVPLHDLLLDLVCYYRQTLVHQHPNWSSMEGHLVARKTIDCKTQQSRQRLIRTGRCLREETAFRHS